MFATLGLGDDDLAGILLPTCPLRTAEDLRGALKLFIAKGGRIPVVSVTTYETPIQLAHVIGDQGRLEAVFPNDYRRSTRSTDHQIAYHYNEAVVFNTIGNFRCQHNLIGDNPYPYEMPAERSILLDFPFQLKLVRQLIEPHKK